VALPVLAGRDSRLANPKQHQQKRPLPQFPQVIDRTFPMDQIYPWSTMTVGCGGQRGKIDNGTRSGFSHVQR